MAERGTHHIYVLVDPTTGEIMYVGRTQDLRSRYSTHVGSDGGTCAKFRWTRGLILGELFPIMYAVDIVPDDDSPDELENDWMCYLDSIGAHLLNDPHDVRNARFDTRAAPRNAGVKRIVDPRYFEERFSRREEVPLSLRVRNNAVLKHKNLAARWDEIRARIAAQGASSSTTSI